MKGHDPETIYIDGEAFCDLCHTPQSEGCDCQEFADYWNGLSEADKKSELESMAIHCDTCYACGGWRSECGHEAV